MFETQYENKEFKTISVSAESLNRDGYADRVFTGIYRRMHPIGINEPFLFVKAKGFQSLEHARQYFTLRCPELSLAHGVALWMSNVTSDGRVPDFSCEAVPNCFFEGVEEIS